MAPYGTTEQASHIRERRQAEPLWQFATGLTSCRSGAGGGTRQSFPAAEIIVVDDGSSDATGAVAAQHAGVRILRHAFNRGYGAALKTGMSAARGTLIAWFDADAEHRAADLRAMVDRLGRERLAAVISQRRSAGAGFVRALYKSRATRRTAPGKLTSRPAYPSNESGAQAAFADAVNVAAFLLTKSCTRNGPCPVNARTSSDIRS